VLEDRFNVLRNAKPEARKALFRESRDRKITFETNRDIPGGGLPSIYELKGADKIGTIMPYSFRSFDRQFAIVDTRFGDYLRPPLMASWSDKQIYLTTLLTEPLAAGAALTVPHIFQTYIISEVPSVEEIFSPFGATQKLRSPM
jgi:hypothetical protein